MVPTTINFIIFLAQMTTRASTTTTTTTTTIPTTTTTTTTTTITTTTTTTTSTTTTTPGTVLPTSYLSILISFNFMCFELLYLGYVYFQKIELMVIGAIGVIGPTVLWAVEDRLKINRDYATTRNLKMVVRNVLQRFQLAVQQKAAMSLPVQVG